MCISIETIASILLGALITWFFSWFYYKRAGDELRREARTLRSATDAILYIQQNPGARVELQRDAHGVVTGVLVNIEGISISTSASTGDLKDAPGA